MNIKMMVFFTEKAPKRTEKLER